MITKILFDIPDPMYSAQQFTRFYHLDIPHLPDEELQTEFYSLRSLLFWLPPEKQWIKERVRELRKEYGRRHYKITSQSQIATNEIIKGVEL